MTSSTEPISNPSSSEEVQTTIPGFPSLSVASVSSRTSCESEPWCNSIGMPVLSLRIDAMYSDSPLVFVNNKTGESKWYFVT